MNSSRDRLLELLADEALGESPERSDRELELLLIEHRDIPRDALTAIVARIDLSGVAGPGEAMPSDVRDRLATIGRQMIASPRSPSAGRANARDGSEFRAPSPLAAPRRSVLTVVALAAAAVLVLGFAWLLRGPPVADPGGRGVDPFADFVARAPDVRQIAWTPGPDPEGSGTSVAGEIAFSLAEQSGFMRFRGLRRNDPTVETYQLWIFSKGSDERYPIDGGVFDCAAGAEGECVVPIDAKLRFDEPTLFAVTVERPGGVVVSSRARIAAIATP